MLHPEMKRITEARHRMKMNLARAASVFKEVQKDLELADCTHMIGDVQQLHDETAELARQVNV
jgi:hypothetical protein